MCTVILAHRILEGRTLLFAGNRDEQLARPSAPPTLDVQRSPKVLAPRDLLAGGTWLGLNESGVFAAITNRFGRTADRTRRSRGELVDMALECAGAAEAAARIAALSGRAYNPFHLACVDEEQVHLVVGDGETMHHSRPESGLLVFTEQSFGAGEDRRRDWVLERCEELLQNGALDEDRLISLLTRCDEGSIEATCVSIPELDYGTRSSTILALGRQSTLLHAEGSPCSTNYEDLTPLLKKGSFRGGSGF